MAIFNEFPQTNFHDLNLDWLVAELKSLKDKYADLDVDGIVGDLQQAIAGNTAAIASLNNRFAALENGAYIDNYVVALRDWINANLEDLIGDSVKFVQFGLTDSGYFYADIPTNWSNLQFSTGYDLAVPDEYMHLIINY